MGFYDDLLKGIREAIEKDHAGVVSRLAKEADAHPSTLTRIIEKERSKWLGMMCRIADAARLRVSREPVETAREICFVNMKPVNTAEDVDAAHLPSLVPEDYIAVPLAEEAVAAGPGLIPQDRIRGWMMVWRHHEAIKFTNNLVAVEIGKNERSMLPTFAPGDILLVDRSNRHPEQPGKTWLVCDPDGACAIKRVSTKNLEGDIEIIFYSDNTQDFPPSSYRLKRDFDGDISRAVAGRVVLAWSDTREK